MEETIPTTYKLMQ